MRKYFRDYLDLFNGNKCPNDFSLLYALALEVPTYIICTFIVMLLSLFFKPVICKADTTYYDYEKVEVSELPQASDSTLDKVYIYGDKYYITNKEVIGGEVTPIPFNENMNGKTIYLNTEVFYNLIHNELSDNNRYHSIYYNGHKPFYLNYQSLYLNTDSKYYFWHYLLCSDYEDFDTKGYCHSSVTIDFDVTYDSSHSCDDVCQLIRPLLSLTPFETTTTYSWVEVSKENVLPVIQNKIYVPTDNLSCYRFIDRYTLRGYFSKPNINDNVSYYDFYLDQHYNSVEGTEIITEEVSCLSNTTTDYLYRHDIVHILIFFLIVSFFVIYIPIKILFRLFRRFN